MHRQQTLPLDGQESLAVLWQRFPEKGRREVIAISPAALADPLRPALDLGIAASQHDRRAVAYSASTQYRVALL
jgi:hypothetical protein